MTDASSGTPDPKPSPRPSGGSTPAPPAAGKGGPTGPGGTPGAAPRKDDVASLVRTIQKDVAQREEAMRVSVHDRYRSKWWYAALVLAIAGNLYIWIGRPTWIVGDSLEPATALEAEGILRFRMYVQGQRIENYRRQNGVLPARLEETGTPIEGMRYQQTGPESWELLGVSGPVSLILRSSQPMAEFLGEYQAALEADGQ